MNLDIEQATKMIADRDRAFVNCDMDAYLALWAEDCCVEGPGYRLSSRQELKDTISMAWELMEPMHFETKSLGVTGSRLFHEFVLVWRTRESGEIFPQSGMMTVEVGSDGKWGELHEYFDPQETSVRDSTTAAKAVREITQRTAKGA